MQQICLAKISQTGILQRFCGIKFTKSFEFKCFCGIPYLLLIGSVGHNCYADHFYA